jgi:hypothetical protein
MDEDDQKIVNSDDDEEILVKTSMIPKKKVNDKDVTTKRINPNDFIQTTEIKDFNEVESSEDEDEDEQDAFKADIATFDSGTTRLFLNEVDAFVHCLSQNITTDWNIFCTQVFLKSKMTEQAILDAKFIAKNS